MVHSFSKLLDCAKTAISVCPDLWDDLREDLRYWLKEAKSLQVTFYSLISFCG